MKHIFMLNALLTLSVVGCSAAPNPVPTSVKPTEPRLLGTWMSDADRTIEFARRTLILSAEREAIFLTIFGRMRVTYSETTCSTDFDGTLDTFGYHVLGSDATSVAIRSIGSQVNNTLKLSEFSVIHFDGPNAFWIEPELGPREYFKRVK